MGGFLNSNKRLWVISIGIIILLMFLVKPVFAASPCEAQCEMEALDRGGIYASSTCGLSSPWSDCVTMGSKTYASIWVSLPLSGASSCGCNLMDVSPYCNYYMECDPSEPACNPNSNPPCTYLTGNTQPSLGNCSGISANYNCSVECAKTTQPAACEQCCRCNITGGGGGGGDRLPPERTRAAARVIAVDNLITGAALSCTSGYVPKLCSAIVDTSGNCNVCGCGILPSGCNNNSACEPGFGENETNCPKDCGCNYNGACDANRSEDATNCVFDCTLCTQRTNQTACEGPGPNGESHRWCKWCSMPDTSAFPYNFSSLYKALNLTGTFACLDTSIDPFNCGGCGFTSNGLSSTSHFCQASATPFCTGGVCVGWRQSSCNAIRPISTPYFYYGITDNYVFDNLYGNRSYYTYNSTWCDGNSTFPVYSISDYDKNDLVCSQVTIGNTGTGSYDFSYSLGCCGDDKCRVESGNMCGITSLCDGTQWRLGSDTNGMVFTSSCSPYPIANINEEFIKCVDNNRYVNYSLMMSALYSEGEQVCAPESSGLAIDFNLTGVLDYSCGPHKYSYSTIALFDNSDYCKVKDINASSVSTGGDFVCVGWGDQAAMQEMYGFATIYNRTINLWNSPNNGYAQCPAMPTEWIVQTTPEFVTSVPSTVLSCPGKETINSGQIRNAIKMALYGGDTPRAALFCKTGKPTGAEGLGSLRYVSGDGSLMGTVNNQDYMCYTGTSGSPSRAKIAVCCGGDQGCDASVGAAEQVLPGNTITIGGFRLACQADGHWSSNLDSVGAQATCNSSGLFGTGTYCCSELDDNASSIWTRESYNQPGGPGGCFRGTRQTNNRFLSYNGVTYSNIFVVNGSFYGCGFDSTFNPEFNQGNQTLCQPDADGRLSTACLQSIEDWPDPGSNFVSSSARRSNPNRPLINRMSYCTGLSVPNSPYQGVYCAFNGSWAYSFGSTLSHMSTIPDPLLNYFITAHGPGISNTGCCDSTSCWGSQGCEAEQAANTGFYNLSGSYYKCVQGEWTSFSVYKRTPDKCFYGFCPDVSQCFYHFVNTTSGYFGCVDNGRYVNDSLCDDGNWTSRTKMLASKLANLTSNKNNFVLMCGPPSDVLINAKTSQSLGSTNNYCVLNLDGQRIVGTTLNQQFYNATSINTYVNNLMWSFNNIYQYMTTDSTYPASFDFTCNEASTGFAVDCMGGGSDHYLELYYDKTYQMVIFSDQPISGLTPSFGQTICNALPGWMQWLCPNPTALSEDMAGVKLFNKIYAAKNGTTKRVFGVKESMCGDDIYSFNYTGYLKEELIPLILYPDVGVYANFTSDNTIYIKRSELIPWDPWTALTILRTLGPP